jgi:hypothetical protein
MYSWLVISVILFATYKFNVSIYEKEIKDEYAQKQAIQARPDVRTIRLFKLLGLFFFNVIIVGVIYNRYSRG